MQNKTPIIVAIVVLIALFAFSLSVYTISETEQVIITQFGQVKRVVADAGLHFKLPIVEQVNTFEKRILEWDGNPTQVPTLDKRYIWVDSLARWRIKDPLKFFQQRYSSKSDIEQSSYQGCQKQRPADAGDSRH
jgi:membrane protease subunit HflC